MLGQTRGELSFPNSEKGKGKSDHSPQVDKLFQEILPGYFYTFMCLNIMFKSCPNFGLYKFLGAAQLPLSPASYAYAKVLLVLLHPFTVTIFQNSVLTLNLTLALIGN